MIRIILDRESDQVLGDSMERRLGEIGVDDWERRGVIGDLEKMVGNLGEDGQRLGEDGWGEPDI